MELDPEEEGHKQERNDPFYSASDSIRFGQERREADPFRIRVVVGVNESLSPLQLAATLAALEAGAQAVFLSELLDVIAAAKRSSSHATEGHVLENAMLVAFVGEYTRPEAVRSYRLPSSSLREGICRIEKIRSGSVEIDYVYLGCITACYWMLNTTLGHAVKKSFENSAFFDWLVDFLKGDVLPLRKLRFRQSFGSSHLEVLRALIETQESTVPDNSRDLVMVEPHSPSEVDSSSTSSSTQTKQDDGKR
jgi:hypothetical protein